MKDNKLNIFWIEDNTILQDPNLTESGLSLPKLIQEDKVNYYIFQHPAEVKDYLDCIKKMKSNSSLNRSWQWAIPDIVYFDYLLKDNLRLRASAVKYSEQEGLDYLKKHNVAYKLKEKFPDDIDFKIFLEREDVQLGNFSIDQFKETIKTHGDITDDEMGLFCAYTILSEFKPYISIGIPASINKLEPDSKGVNSLVFEWLNDIKIEQGINVSALESKNWKEYLKFGVPKLRNNILYKISTGEILPEYPTLMKLIEKLPADPNERILTFSSEYGIRSVGLNALFLEMNEMDNIDAEIKVWCESVIDAMVRSFKRNQSTINAAISKYEKLYKKFQEHFLDRILLSYFSKKEQEILNLTSKIDISNDVEKEKLNCEIANIKDLTAANEDDYNRLKIKFEVVNSEITNIKLLCSVQHEYESFIGGKKITFPIEEARLLILLLVTRLWIDYQSTNEGKPLYKLSKEDYFNILNPITNSYKGLVLLMHCDKGSPSPSDYTGRFQKFLKDNLKIKSNHWNFESWIDVGEKLILSSIFQKELRRLNNKPNWLK